MRRLSVLLSLFGLLAAVPAMEAENKGNSKNKAKQESKRESQRNRDQDEDLGGWARRTEGHRPHDLDGDGLITRKEWPGNDDSFRRLDRNGDGIISEYDRAMRPNTSNIHGSRRRSR
jgi:hypothetical protein